MKLFAALLILVLIPLMYAQDKTQTPGKKAAHAASGSADFKSEMQKRADEWKAAFQAKEVSKVAAMYTDDAVWINAEGTFHGPGEIKSELQKMVERGDTVATIVTTKAVHSGDIGYCEGTYSGKAPHPNSGAEEPAHGSWVVTLKNSNGKWMLATHTSLPAVSAAPMSKSATKSE